MRLLLLVSSLVISVSCTNWAGYDVLSAHGGVFRVLPWTPQELIHVSSLHSRAEYHKLMHFIKEKLIVSGGDLKPEERQKIERFLVSARPPHVVEHLFDEEEKQAIDVLHSRGDVTDVLSIWSTALERLPDALREKIVTYLQSEY